MNLEAVKLYIKPSYLIAALRNPRAAWHLLRRTVADLSQVGNVLVGVDRKQFRLYIHEIREDRSFNEHLWSRVKKVETQLRAEGLTLGVFPHDACIFIYALVRALKPAIVLETGVASGMSSSYILAALEANKNGRLYSIDLPHESEKLQQKSQKTIEQHSLPKEQTGWLILNELRSKWTLRVGKSSEVLPALLKDLGQIDIFLHDSAHTYENMMFEYETVWPYLKDGGVLVSDNIDYNRAFSDFSRRVQAKKFEYGSFGAIVKPTI